jgi:hypothetical protein
MRAIASYGMHWHGREHGPFVQASKAVKRGALDPEQLPEQFASPPLKQP